jgi:hypothetical protein
VTFGQGFSRDEGTTPAATVTFSQLRKVLAEILAGVPDDKQAKIAGVRDKADPGEDLIRLEHDLVSAGDPLYPRRTILERRIDAGLPQIGRFEHERVRPVTPGQHRHPLSLLIAGSTFGSRPIAVKVSADSDRYPLPKAGLGSTWAEPRPRLVLARTTGFGASRPFRCVPAKVR